MSVAIQNVSGFVLGSVPGTALNPVITGALLWAITKGPPSLKARLLRPFASLPYDGRPAGLIKTLKWLFALGLVVRINRVLNHTALNSWRLRSEKKRWDWNNEVAVVTGGSSGIGELVVKGLMKKGVKVAVLDVQPLPDSLKNFANVKFFECDITSASTVHETADSIRSTLGPPSILVNNAGIASAHTILDTSDEYLRKVFDVNLLSNFTTVKAFLPDMIVKNKGHIVTVASCASFITVAGLVDYCSTKAGVFSFHEGLSQELKHRYSAPNVLTTSIHPSWVRTPLVDSWAESLRNAKADLLTPQTIADAIVKQILSCSGGQRIIPSKISNVAGLRGWPNWLQEVVRDSTSNQVYGK
ncbi:dehydrogenase/reductase SDR family member 8 precursor [Lepidopterella palustris CBS 459.81]|uniref:Short-chain dehydrogenase/reductase 3 n=1 Tax=Lepidopterella palustris CBS 459.81 TaxID=1314670 RepID=A0A8E2JCE8_9PEZI|nr:dehydrogenase/reductase SDR family member 8 precursor [Lepidopterella palustris CBS 459.81]